MLFGSRDLVCSSDVVSKDLHDASEDYNANIRSSCSACISKRRSKGQSIKHAHTEVVDKHRRALDKGEHRILLQLHIFGNLWVLRCPSVTMHANYSATGKNTRTADFAIRVTSARGSSKFSMPSETESCCACAEAGVLELSFRGMIGLRI